MALDGGGSKLLCLISDESGNLCGTGAAGPTNSHFNSEQEIEQSLAQAIDQALLDAGILRTDLAAVNWAMPVFHEYGQAVVAKLTHPDAVVRNCEEYHLSLYAAIQEEFGAVCLAGTGSFTMSNTREHGARYIGGWGSLFGDEGSGYAIGRQAFGACTHMVDRIGPETSIHDKMLREFQFNDLKDLLLYMHGLQKGEQRKHVASICRLVGASAREGDEVAIRILRDAAVDLAHTTIETLKLDGAAIYTGFPVTVAGGVWKAHPVVYETFAERVKAQHPQVEVHLPLFEPVVGGILMALRDRNFPVQDNRERLKHIYADYLFRM